MKRQTCHAVYRNSLFTSDSWEMPQLWVANRCRCWRLTDPGHNSWRSMSLTEVTAVLLCSETQPLCSAGQARKSAASLQAVMLISSDSCRGMLAIACWSHLVCCTSFEGCATSYAGWMMM